jgi:flavin-dependent dehydrogenase
MAHRRQSSRLAVVERLAPRATALLSDLGLLSRIDACTGVECPGVRSQWGPGDPITHRGIFDPYGCGWTVDRTRFDDVLREAAVAQGARIICGAVTRLARSKRSWELALSTREEEKPVTCCARNVLLASGRSSWLVRQLGAIEARAASEVAMLASFSAISSAWADDPLLLVEAFSGGWAYGLPAPVGGALTGVCLPAACCRGAVRHGLRPFWERWHAQTVLLRYAVGAAAPQHVEGRAAHAQRRWPVIGPGWALAGDAACAQSPLSGHGVTFALESGRLAALAILRGEPAGLASYARWVQRYWADHERASAHLSSDVAV